MFVVQTLAAPTNFTYQGQIIKPSGQALEGAAVTFTIEVLSPAPSECVLYEEQHILNMSNSNGIFAIEVGTGTQSGADYEDVNSLTDAINNSIGLITPTTCVVGPNYNPASTDGRQIRVTFDDGSGPVTVSQNHNLVSVPFADSASSIDGLASADILQINTGGSFVLDQANLEWIFATNARYTELQALINGTSTQYLQGTPAADFSMNSNKITDLAAPTNANDATNKNYVDSNIGGVAADTATIGALAPGNAGEVMTWNGTQWTSGVPAGDSTKLPLAGGTMTGSIDMGTNNITNANNLAATTTSTTNLAIVNGDASFMGFVAPAGSADLYWTLPAADGGAGQILSTNGSGVLSWVNDSAPVDDVFGRTGSVVATAGDYDANQVDNTAAGNIAATDVQAAINELDTEKVAKAGDNMTGALTMDAENEIRFADNDDSHYVGFKAPATIAAGASFVWELPDDDGANGEVLQTNGAGVLSFVAIPTAPVADVFGRTGNVVAQASDYDANQVDNTPAGNIAATDVQAAINELDTEKVNVDYPGYTDLGAAADNADTFVLYDSSATALREVTRAQVVLSEAEVDAYAGNNGYAADSRNINTAADSGLTGGGDLSADRSLSVDIPGTTDLGAAADNADSLLIYDASGTALREVTRAQLVLSEAEVDAYAGNNGYLTSESDTLANVTGRGASTTDDITMGSEAETRYADSVGGEYAAIKAPNDLAANYTLTLPADDGNNLEVLQTDGSGGLSWVGIPSAPVADVFGRTGNVVATAGDYSANQVTNVAAGNVAATDVQAAINELDTEKVGTGRAINTAAGSGLQGGGDLSADRSLSLDIPGVADLGAAVDNADSVIVYDASGTAIAEATRAQFVLSEAEVDAYANNNGYAADADKVDRAGDNMTGALTMDAENEIRFADNDDSHYVGFKAPATIAAGASFVWELPDDDGANGEVLQTNGAGVLSFVAIPSAPVTDVFGRSGNVVAQASDYDANQVDNTPAGNIAATDVQAAINELDTEKVNVDYPGYTDLGAAADNADTFVLYDSSATALREVTRAQLVLSEAEVDAYANNNGYAAGARSLTAGAGLTGGGDLTADRTFDVGAGDGISVAADSVAVDIPGTTDLGAAVDNADSILVYDASGTALREATRSELVLSEAEVDAYANNNGYGDIHNNGDAGAIVLGSNDNTLSLEANNSVAMTITTAGDVGVNSATPRSKFEVVGDIQIGSDAAACVAAKAGAMRYTGGNVEFCNGTVWQAFGTAAGGEVNTASNQGAGGVGVFDTKNGVDFEFKNINNGSEGIAVANDAGNTEIDISLDIPGVTDLGAAADNADTFLVYDTSGTALREVTRAQVVLSEAEVDAYANNNGYTPDSRNINTVADSGLTGGGDLSADRSLSVDIPGTTDLGAVADNADTFLVYDVSGTALREVTRAQVVLTEAEVDAYAGNNGYGDITGGSSIGTAGVDVYRNENTGVLEFATINNGSEGIAIGDDVVNDEVDISIDIPGITDLGAAADNADTFMVYDASGTALREVTRAQVVLSEAEVDAYANNNGYVADSRDLTAGNGLTGGGDLSANRTFDVGAGAGIAVGANDVSVDIPGTTDLGAAADNADSLLIYDASGTALREVTRAQLVLSEAEVDAYANNNGYVADSRTITAGVGLSGGGDLSANRTIDVDINSETAETTVNAADELLIYDDSATAIRKMTRANFVLSEAEVDAYANNNGYGDIHNNGDAGAIVLGSNDNTLSLEANNSVAMTITTAGDVGVSSATPRSLFEVAGDIQIGSSAAACVAAKAGAMRYTGGNVEYCNGTAWQAFGTAAGGEVNTASNQGAGGVGVFDTKNGVDLEFKNINNGSEGIAVANDAGNTEIDISLDIPGVTDLGATADNADTFLVYDTSGTALREVTRAQVVLSEAEVDAYANNNGYVADSRDLTAGNGLTGGGDLSANRTFDVGAGAGIAVGANDVSVDIPGTTDLGAAADNADSLLIYDASGTALREVTRAQLVLSEAEVDAYANNNGYLTAEADTLAAVTGRGATTTDDITMSSEAEIRYADSVGGQYAAIKAPNDLSANYTLTLPADDGTSGQVLQTNGSGVLSWVASGAGDFMADGSVAMTGNLQLGSNYISNDGDSEGLSVDSAGRVEITGLTASDHRLEVNNTSSGASSSRSVMFRQGGNTMGRVGVFAEGSVADNSMRFETRISGTNAERMRIHSDGNVGIASTSPRSLFEVAGDIQIGSSAAACVAAKAGAMRYTGGNVEFCNGTSWQAFGTAAGGEVNTASNQGAGGVGVFDTKNGVDFEFKNINNGSEGIAVANDGANTEIDISLDIPGVTDLGAAADNADTFLVYDTSGTALREVTRAQVVLSEAEVDAYANNNGYGDITGGSSIGTGGVDVYRSENSGALEFATINNGSEGISIGDDVVNDEVDISIDIPGITDLGAAADNADTFMVYDTSGTALREVTRAQVVLSEAEVDAYANNNGYLTAEADTLSAVTGRGATTTDDITMSSEAEIRYADSVGGQYAAIKAPNDLSANYTLTLPADDGTSGQVLQTNGSGVLSWVAAGGGGDFMADGSVPMTGALHADYGTVSLPGIAFDGDTDTGIYRMSSNNLGISAGGVHTVEVDATGATIGGGNRQGSAELTVVDSDSYADLSISAHGDNFYDNPYLNFYRSRGTQSAKSSVNSGNRLGSIDSFGYSGTSYPSTINTVATSIRFIAEEDMTSDTNQGARIEFHTTPTGTGTNALAMTIKGSGNVGIGTNVPGGKLDVDGDIRMLGSTSGYAGIQAPATATNMVYTLPSTDPTPGQILSSDASGNLSWIAAGGGASAIDDLSDGDTSSGTAVVFLGANAGANNTSNTSTAVGANALDLNTSGINTAFGSSALTNVTTGSANTAVGRNALSANTGSSNTAVGDQALQNNAGGAQNSGFGVSALRNTTSGGDNVTVGFQALFNNTTGDSNTVVGSSAGGNVGVADGDMDNNTIIGYRAGYNFTGGASGAGPNNNILLGYQAGDVITTGDNNIIIGYDIDPTSATASNELNIGNAIYGNLSTGNVGIGTTSPNEKLNINGGGLRIQDSGGGLTTGLKLRNESTSADSGTYVGFESGGSGFSVAQVSGYRGNNSNEGYLAFSTRNTSLSEKMRITTAGNVGIGTNAPAVELDVHTGTINAAAICDENNANCKDISTGWSGGGDFMADGSVAMTGPLEAAVGSAAAPSLTFDGDEDTGFYSVIPNQIGVSFNGTKRMQLNQNGFYYEATGAFKLGAGAGAAFPSYSFYNDDNTGMYRPGVADTIAFSTAGSERVRIDSSGHVGINNASPSVELDVTGDIEYSGTLTDVSDRRLKDDIMPLENSLGKVLRLQGVSFVMKDDESRRKEIGVIAQEVEEVMPELVHTADDEMQSKSVNYIGFIGYIIESVKELSQKFFDREKVVDRELASLKAENEKLKIENEALKEKVDNHEERLKKIEEVLSK